MSTPSLTTPEGEPLETVLRRETGLPAAMVDALLIEYRRFLALDAAMGGAAEPPSPLAQVRGWHLTGTAGAVSPETPAYAATLSRYRATFGVEPPGAIWPGLVQKATWRRGGRMLLAGVILGPLSMAGEMVSDHWLFALGQLAATVAFFWGLAVWLKDRPLSVARPAATGPGEEMPPMHSHQMMMHSPAPDERHHHG